LFWSSKAFSRYSHSAFERTHVRRVKFKRFSAWIIALLYRRWDYPAIIDPMRDKLDDLLEQQDRLLRLQAAIKERLSTATEQEKLEVEALSKRAINPECAFDRKHREQLYQLALFPNTVSWRFKLRERLHRLIHDH